MRASIYRLARARRGVSLWDPGPARRRVEERGSQLVVCVEHVQVASALMSRVNCLTLLRDAIVSAVRHDNLLAGRRAGRRCQAHGYAGSAIPGGRRSAPLDMYFATLD
jgi:hypothetical protein